MLGTFWVNPVSITRINLSQKFKTSSVSSGLKNTTQHANYLRREKLGRIILNQNRLFVGAKVALVVLAHAKAGAAGTTKALVPAVAPEKLRKDKGAIQRLSEQLSEAVSLSIPARLTSAPVALLRKQTAAQAQPAGRAMSQEALRIWLQSYNAGPYAVLKYRGNVPYRETRQYAPRVFRYYTEDLSNTQFDPYIVASAQKYGLDPQMIRAIMKTESDFRTRTVSHAGARGLMQVMPCVWSEVKKRYGLAWNYATDVFDPAKNIEVACAYLAWLRYDFLPSKFNAFEPAPAAPPALVRDVRLAAAPARVRKPEAAPSLSATAAPQPQIEIAKPPQMSEIQLSFSTQLRTRPQSTPKAIATTYRKAASRLRKSAVSSQLAVASARRSRKTAGSAATAARTLAASQKRQKAAVAQKTPRRARRTASAEAS